MKRSMSVLAEGLGHPEGPDVLSDGRVVMVETYMSRIVAWSSELGVHMYSDCGGGPNACMLGSDGALYITQNGGTVGSWKARVMVQPSIQKALPDGRVEEVVTELDGVEFLGPNDLTFGPNGRLYFTDPGDYYPDAPSMGRLFVLNPDGSGGIIEEIGPSYPNGIVAEPDGSLVWVESYKRHVFRKRPGKESELICELPKGHIPDGLKIDETGNLWVTAFMGGGVDVLSKDGEMLEFLETGGVPLNCVFDGQTLLVTDFGDVQEVTSDSPMGGRLLRIDVGTRGMPLFRGEISKRLKK